MIISNIGACICVTLGCIALIYPRIIEVFVSIDASSVEGKSEVRATYGGFFLGISTYALYSQSADAFITIGIGWLGAALARVITLITGSFSLKNLGGVLFEVLIGTLCIGSLI